MNQEKNGILSLPEEQKPWYQFSNKIWIIFGVVIVVIAFGISGYFLYDRNVKLSNDVQVIFLRDGNLYVADAIKGEVEPYILDEHITQFTFSSDNKDLYFSNEKGELIKRNQSGETQKLISKELDMEETETLVDSRDDPSGEEIFISGKVGRFFVSPDNKWIIYEKYDEVGGCCMLTIPVSSLWLMKSDGLDKKLAVPRDNSFINYVAWGSNSDHFIYNLGEPSTTMGSPFYVITLDGEKSELQGIKYNAVDNKYVTVARAEPAFSPQGHRFVYHKGGLSNYFGVETDNEIWLTNTTNKKTSPLFDVKDSLNRAFEWSEDGHKVLIAADHRVALFDENGILLNDYIPASEDSGLYTATLSDDARYIAMIFASKIEGVPHDFKFKIIRLDTQTNLTKEINFDLPKDIVLNNETTISPARLHDLNFLSNNTLYITVLPRTSPNFAEPIVPCENMLNWCGMWIADFDNERFVHSISGAVQNIVEQKLPKDSQKPTENFNSQTTLMGVFEQLKKDNKLEECHYFDYETCKIKYNVSEKDVISNALRYGIIDEESFEGDVTLGLLKGASVSIPGIGTGYIKNKEKLGLQDDKWYWEIGACSTNRRAYIDAENGEAGLVHTYVYCGGMP